MKYAIEADRSRRRLQKLQKQGRARYDSSARLFYDTRDWLRFTDTFVYEGDLVVDERTVLVNGEIVFSRLGNAWTKTGTESMYDAIRILPTFDTMGMPTT